MSALIIGEAKAAVRHTIRPGFSTPLFLTVVPGATCRLRRHDDPDPARSLKLFADDDGIICMHVRSPREVEQIEKFVIDCEAHEKITRYPLELRSARRETADMPFPQRQRPPYKESASIRP